MKTLQKSLLALSASALMATAANASIISYGASADAQPYVGVKAAQVDADQMTRKPMAYGVYGGYNFDQNFGVEAEFLRSDNKDFTSAGTAYEGEVKSYGAYGTYRYNFNNTPFYAKGKIGVSKTEVDVTSKAGNIKRNFDKTGVAGGLGVGFKPTSNFGVEAGYNYLSKDVKALSVGAHLAF